MLCAAGRANAADESLTVGIDLPPKIFQQTETFWGKNTIFLPPPAPLPSIVWNFLNTNEDNFPVLMPGRFPEFIFPTPHGIGVQGEPRWDNYHYCCGVLMDSFSDFVINTPLTYFGRTTVYAQYHPDELHKIGQDLQFDIPPPYRKNGSVLVFWRFEIIAMANYVDYTKICKPDFQMSGGFGVWSTPWPETFATEVFTGGQIDVLSTLSKGGAGFQNFLDSCGIPATITITASPYTNFPPSPSYQYTECVITGSRLFKASDFTPQGLPGAMGFTFYLSNSNTSFTVIVKNSTMSAILLPPGANK